MFRVGVQRRASGLHCVFEERAERGLGGAEVGAHGELAELLLRRERLEERRELEVGAPQAVAGVVQREPLLAAHGAHRLRLRDEEAHAQLPAAHVARVEHAVLRLVQVAAVLPLRELLRERLQRRQLLLAPVAGQLHARGVNVFSHPRMMHKCNAQAHLDEIIEHVWKALGRLVGRQREDLQLVEADSRQAHSKLDLLAQQHIYSRSVHH